jgi:hypothetical protein
VIESPVGRFFVSLVVFFVIVFLRGSALRSNYPVHPALARSARTGGFSCGLSLGRLLFLLEEKVLAEDHRHHLALLFGLGRIRGEALDVAVDGGDAFVDGLHREDALQLLHGDAEEDRQFRDAPLEVVGLALALGHLRF